MFHIGFIILLVIKYYVDIPYADQWNLVPWVEHLFNDTLTLRHLWEQKGDHRLFVPMAIWMVLIKFTDWNIVWELFLIVACYSLLYIVFLYQIKLTKPYVGITSISFFAWIVAVVIFSARPFENWLWGMQLTYSINLLFSILGIVLLSNIERNRMFLLLAMLCGLIATHSFSFGLAYWPICFLTLYFSDTSPSVYRRHNLLWWGIISLIAYISFFYNFEMIKDVDHNRFYAKDVYNIILFSLTLIGNPMSRNLPHEATYIGSIHFAIILFICIYIVSKYATYYRSILVPFLSIMSYSLLCGLLIAIGRSGEGYQSAFWTRYLGLTNIAWLCLMILMCFAIHLLYQKNKNSSCRYKLGITVLVIMLSWYSTCFVLDSLRGGRRSFKKHNYELQQGYIALLCGSSFDDETLKVLHPSLQYLKEKANILHLHGLSVYSNRGGETKKILCKNRKDSRE